MATVLRFAAHSLAATALMASLAPGAQTLDPVPQQPAARPAKPATPPKKATPPATPDRFEAQLRFAGLYFDNFFQAPEGAPGENVAGANLEGRITLRLDERRPLRAYLEADYVVYQDFDPSRGIGAGVRLEGRPHAWDVLAQYLQGRPSREVRDEFDRADVVGLNVQYSYRITEGVELIGLGEARHESFELSPDKANDVFNLGPALRYRGFGSEFSPELGLRLGGRSARDENEGLSQREVYLRLRWVPSPPVYVTMRLRHRRREYGIDDARASNFGREDNRRQLVLSADWKRGKHVVWNLYYSLEDSASTRPTGEFRAQLVSLGLSYRF